MAKNGAQGNGRTGAVRNRPQVRNPTLGLWKRRDTSTGRFVELKKTGGSFKGVQRED